jgi:hypothetical protein
LAKCTGITRDGERCRGIAIDGSDYCYAHDPDRAEERKRAASKGGKRGGRGHPSVELARLQACFEDLAEKVLSEDEEQRVDRAVAAVAGQLLNGARACARDALAAREQEELVARLEALEGRCRISPNGEPPPISPKREAALRELRETRERAYEKAEREAAEGDYRRLNALRELDEHVKRRVRERGGGRGA